MIDSGVRWARRLPNKGKVLAPDGQKRRQAVAQ